MGDGWKGVIREMKVWERVHSDQTQNYMYLNEYMDVSSAGLL